jgi:hypothetical protein
VGDQRRANITCSLTKQQLSRRPCSSAKLTFHPEPCRMAHRLSCSWATPGQMVQQLGLLLLPVQRYSTGTNAQGQQCHTSRQSIYGGWWLIFFSDPILRCKNQHIRSQSQVQILWSRESHSDAFCV